MSVKENLCYLGDKELARLQDVLRTHKSVTALVWSHTQFHYQEGKPSYIKEVNLGRERQEVLADPILLVIDSQQYRGQASEHGVWVTFEGISKEDAQKKAHPECLGCEGTGLNHGLGCRCTKPYEAKMLVRNTVRVPASTTATVWVARKR